MSRCVGICSWGVASQVAEFIAHHPPTLIKNWSPPFMKVFREIAEEDKIYCMFTGLGVIDCGSAARDKVEETAELFIWSRIARQITRVKLAKRSQKAAYDA